MSRRDRRRYRGRSDGGSFAAIPHAVLNSANYLALSWPARSLLLDLLAQFKGRNNGDLCAAWVLMASRGWKSRDTLSRALAELRHYGLIQLTRQGGLNLPSLYAVTWKPVDECGGKLDIQPCPMASALWKEPRSPLKRPSRRNRKTERQHGSRVSSTREAC